MEQMDQEEISKLLEFDPNKPSKSWTELLLENPQQKGGLAQLALREQMARLSSAEAPKTS